ENQAEKKCRPVEAARYAELRLVNDVVEHEEEGDGHRDRAVHHDIDRRIAVRSLDGARISGSGTTDRLQRRPHAVANGLDEREQRPDTSDGHRANSQIPDASAPD